MNIRFFAYTLFILFSILPLSPLLAQSCAPPSLIGPGVSPGGYAIQGKNDCFMAADVNGGIRGGHSINPNCGGRCDEEINTPDGAMDSVRACLQTKGYAKPGRGTLDGKDGFTEALCRCNEIVFDKKFVCDQMSAQEGVAPGDLELLDELLDNECIVIVTLRMFIPVDPATPHIGYFDNHAVTLTDANSSTPEITVSDPNNPDEEVELPVNPDGSIDQDDWSNPNHPLAGGTVPLRIIRATLKCPELEESSDQRN